MDSDAYAMLAPDDYLDRTYSDQGRKAEIGVFIAYYNSQHKAKGAHDPKVCLPGSGWDAITTKVIQISTPQTTFAANYMLAAKGAWKDVVIYWYQLNDRALTGDEGLHLRRIFETFRENRTDMALVRIVAPVSNGQLANATDSAVDFVRSAYPSIMVQFPPESH
jgi:EpsI family protein